MKLIEITLIKGVDKYCDKMIINKVAIKEKGQMG